MRMALGLGALALATRAERGLFHQAELRLELQLGRPVRLGVALDADERLGVVVLQEVAALLAHMMWRLVAVTGLARLHLGEARPGPGALASVVLAGDLAVLEI